METFRSIELYPSDPSSTINTPFASLLLAPRHKIYSSSSSIAQPEPAEEKNNSVVVVVYLFTLLLSALVVVVVVAVVPCCGRAETSPEDSWMTTVGGGLFDGACSVGNGPAPSD
ncbi:hypothetical protein D917_00831 [Trichinella nativa]|uniref:Uncharacterized protein n=1 Tax=Trichinella nativa TaxID=6335 RepID=A0A1Y3E7H2_9BILA|nr:hypothetical protein D917_00831 [Trichinella nativa]